LYGFINLFQLLLGIDAVQLKEIGRLITATIDFERSLEQHRTTVLQGIDSSLDKMKQQYHGMDSLLTHVANEISNELPEWARPYIENCIFFPQLGFLTVVAIDPISGKCMYEGEGVEGGFWERSFVSDSMGYYKNSHMRDMDAEFGDVWAQICGMLS
jgi:DNA mismatch repair protein MSH5